MQDGSCTVVTSRTDFSQDNANNILYLLHICTPMKYTFQLLFILFVHTVLVLCPSCVPKKSGVNKYGLKNMIFQNEIMVQV
jgi:hypothetical protein